MDAGHCFLLVGYRQCRMHELAVTGNASTLSDAPIAFFDLNWIFESTGRERQRVKETIVGFRYPFADVVMWQVAIIADRHMVMAGVLPRIQVFLHHMTVDARLRVVAEIAGTFAVAESERAEPNKNAQQDRKCDQTFRFTAGLFEIAQSIRLYVRVFH